jgi:hypothetical protein
MRRRSQSLPITIPGKEKELQKQRNSKARALVSAPFIARPLKPLAEALSEMSDSEEDTDTETESESDNESNDTGPFNNIFEME